MIRSRLFDKPSHVHRAQQLPLAVVGELPGYTPGEAYEGRLDILGSIGRCRVDLLEGELPPGTQVFVDNFAKKVVVKWPTFSPARPTEEGIVNNDFSLGSLAGWRDMRGNSWQVGLYDPTTPGYKDNPPPGPAPGNLAAWLRGHGRGNHDLLSDLYPTVPGLPMSASSLWYQGPSNKDNNNLWTGIQFYTPGRVPLGEPVLGDRIHDRTNKARHRSTVTTQAPAGAGFASVLLRAYRRNSRNRELNVDDVTTSGFSYVSETGWVGETDFPLSLRVQDSAGKVAYWSGVISMQPQTRWAVWEYYAAAATPRQFTIPADAEVGSLALMVYTVRGSLAPPTVTGGWTNLGSAVTGASVMSTRLYYRVLTAADIGTTRTITGGTSGTNLIHQTVCLALVPPGSFSGTPVASIQGLATANSTYYRPALSPPWAAESSSLYLHTAAFPTITATFPNSPYGFSGKQQESLLAWDGGRDIGQYFSEEVLPGGASTLTLGTGGPSFYTTATIAVRLPA